jgi:ABC-type transport system involved in multi-copper enzyme maturation permease subunit
MMAWRSFFADPLPTNAILQSVAVLIAHIVGLIGIALYQFNKKDILS